jgi:phosphodiesterase/alkaline phosphatase D-like protein
MEPLTHMPFRARHTTTCEDTSVAPFHGTRQRLAAARTAALIGACLLSVAGMLALNSSRAGAATGHQFLGSISEGPAGSPLLGPTPIAVERSSGRLFVGDPLSGYINVYSASGEYETRMGEGAIEAAGIAVDESSGDIYVAEPFKAAVLVYEPDGAGGYRELAEWSGEGTPNGEFGEVAGVAVDNSTGPSAGDVYVVESRALGGSEGVVDVFRPKPNPQGAGAEGEEGAFVERLSGPRLEDPNGIAVDAGSGRILVADSAKGSIFVFSSSGEYEERLNGSGSPNGAFDKEQSVGDVAALAVDETSGELYVAEAERDVVSEYSSSGAWEGWIATASEQGLGEPSGVTVGSSGSVYVADRSHAVVDRYGTDVPVPDVETGKVTKSALTRDAALVSGTINGDGKNAAYRFQYGETAALGSTTEAVESGASEAAAASELTGLHAGTTYHYRIVGETEDGASYGLTREFTTPPAVEGLATGPVEGLEPTGATLTGRLTPAGVDVHYYFQWGTTTSYGNSTPAPPGGDAGSGKPAVEAEAQLLSLSPNTTYHYRIVASDSYGITYGEDRTFTTPGAPIVSSEPASAIGQTEATIHAAIDPDQLSTDYYFEYGETTAYGSEEPVGGEEIAAGSTPVTVSAALTELRVGATYHYRVIASNEAGVTVGPDQMVTTVPSAPVDATYATGISATGATLHTLIDPLGHDTHYYFQYGAQSCQSDPSACTDTPLAPGTDIGAGAEDIAGEAQLNDLGPATTYYYRVVASNSLGDTDSTERTFTTQQQPANSLVLPDSRSWELVTPPDKGGAPVEALTREGGLILASEQGEALTYVVDGGLGEDVQGNRSPEWQQVLATRGASGWSSQDIATPSSKAKGVTPGQAPEYQFFTPDLSAAIVEPAGESAEPPLAPGVSQATIYQRNNTSGAFLPLVTEADTAAGVHFGAQVHFVSASPDLSHVVIESAVALTGKGSAPGLYEWSNGELALVSVLPNGRPVRAAVELGYWHMIAGAVSTDGARIIWTVPEAAAEAKRGHLYLRDTASDETLQLDAAHGVAEPAGGSAQFQGASSDGSRIFFTDKQRLTPDSTAEAGQAAGRPDLYECEVINVAGKLTCDLTDLTVDHNENEHASVQSFIFGVSEEGTSIYLVAQGVLASNINGDGEFAIDGDSNLYELHNDGSRWSTTFVAALSGLDSPEWEGNQNANSAYLTARVSPNGRYLAFMSAAPITGYDNVDASPIAKGSRDEEVYLFDSATGSLRCVSCNPTGARPAGVKDTEAAGEGLGLLVDRRLVWGREGQEHWLAGNIPGWTAQSLVSALFQSRYLSDEGRLYFDSPDDLVPAATNAKEDVYEYEPSGVGSCESDSGGCISLLSGGSSSRESAFIEATPDASNVFFVTEGQLLPQDTDTAFDIYDARECTATSPCLTPPPPASAGCAEVTTCRPAPPAQQVAAGPAGTSIASGTGNVVSQAPAAEHATQATKASKPLTRAQKLALALRSCRRRYPHARRRRSACERKARKTYGAKRGVNRAVKHRKRRNTSKTNARKISGGRTAR